MSEETDSLLTQAFSHLGSTEDHPEEALEEEEEAMADNPEVVVGDGEEGIELKDLEEAKEDEEDKDEEEEEDAGDDEEVFSEKKNG